MTARPAWADALSEFNYVFHSAIDLVFIVMGFAIIAVVSRPGWQHHLRWANPAAAASILTGVCRTINDLHHYFGVGTAIAAYVTADLFLYGANLVGLYSTFMLWRTLRDLAQRPALPDPLAEQAPPPGVWPPPPVMKR